MKHKPNTQVRKTLLFGSGDDGEKRYTRYYAAAEKAGMEIQEWFRDVLDKEADKLLK